MNGDFLNSSQIGYSTFGISFH